MERRWVLPSITILPGDDDGLDDTGGDQGGFEIYRAGVLAAGYKGDQAIERLVLRRIRRLKRW